MQLYDLLESAPPSAACLLADGMSFCVLDETLFCEGVLPQFFAHTKMTSFQRQLNIYGFRRLVAKVPRSSRRFLSSLTTASPQGDAVCAFFHPCFVRGHPELLASIKVRAKQSVFVAPRVIPRVSAASAEKGRGLRQNRRSAA